MNHSIARKFSAIFLSAVYFHVNVAWAASPSLPIPSLLLSSLRSLFSPNTPSEDDVLVFHGINDWINPPKPVEQPKTPIQTIENEQHASLVVPTMDFRPSVDSIKNLDLRSEAHKVLESPNASMNSLDSKDVAKFADALGASDKMQTISENNGVVKLNVTSKEQNVDATVTMTSIGGGKVQVTIEVKEVNKSLSTEPRTTDPSTKGPDASSRSNIPELFRNADTNDKVAGALALIGKNFLSGAAQVTKLDVKNQATYMGLIRDASITGVKTDQFKTKLADLNKALSKVGLIVEVVQTKNDDFHLQVKQVLTPAMMNDPKIVTPEEKNALQTMVVLKTGTQVAVQNVVTLTPRLNTEITEHGLTQVTGANGVAVSVIRMDVTEIAHDTSLSFKDSYNVTLAHETGHALLAELNPAGLRSATPEQKTIKHEFAAIVSELLHSYNPNTALNKQSVVAAVNKAENLFRADKAPEARDAAKLVVNALLKQFCVENPAFATSDFNGTGKKQATVADLVSFLKKDTTDVQQFMSNALGKMSEEVVGVNLVNPLQMNTISNSSTPKAPGVSDGKQFAVQNGVADAPTPLANNGKENAKQISTLFKGLDGNRISLDKGVVQNLNVGGIQKLYTTTKAGNPVTVYKHTINGKPTLQIETDFNGAVELGINPATLNKLKTSVELTDQKVDTFILSKTEGEDTLVFARDNLSQIRFNPSDKKAEQRSGSILNTPNQFVTTFANVTQNTDVATPLNVNSVVNGQKYNGQTIQPSQVASARMQGGQIILELASPIQTKPVTLKEGDARSSLSGSTIYRLYMDPKSQTITAGEGVSGFNKPLFVPTPDAKDAADAAAQSSGITGLPAAASRNFTVEDVEGGQLLTPIGQQAAVNVRIANVGEPGQVLKGVANVASDFASNIQVGKAGATLLGQHFSGGTLNIGTQGSYTLNAAAGTKVTNKEGDFTITVTQENASSLATLQFIRGQFGEASQNQFVRQNKGAEVRIDQKPADPKLAGFNDAQTFLSRREIAQVYNGIEGKEGTSVSRTTSIDANGNRQATRVHVRANDGTLYFIKDGKVQNNDGKVAFDLGSAHYTSEGGSLNVDRSSIEKMAGKDVVVGVLTPQGDVVFGAVQNTETIRGVTTVDIFRVHQPGQEDKPDFKSNVDKSELHTLGTRFEFSPTADKKSETVGTSTVRNIIDAEGAAHRGSSTEGKFSLDNEKTTSFIFDGNKTTIDKKTGIQTDLSNASLGAEAIAFNSDGIHHGTVALIAQGDSEVQSNFKTFNVNVSGVLKGLQHEGTDVVRFTKDYRGNNPFAVKAGTMTDGKSKTLDILKGSLRADQKGDHIDTAIKGRASVSDESTTGGEAKKADVIALNAEGAVVRGDVDLVRDDKNGPIRTQMQKGTIVVDASKVQAELNSGADFDLTQDKFTQDANVVQVITGSGNLERAVLVKNKGSEEEMRTRVSKVMAKSNVFDALGGPVVSSTKIGTTTNVHVIDATQQKEVGTFSFLPVIVTVSRGKQVDGRRVQEAVLRTNGDSKTTQKVEIVNGQRQVTQTETETTAKVTREGKDGKVETVNQYVREVKGADGQVKTYLVKENGEVVQAKMNQTTRDGSTERTYTITRDGKRMDIRIASAVSDEHGNKESMTVVGGDDKVFRYSWDQKNNGWAEAVKPKNGDTLVWRAAVGVGEWLSDWSWQRTAIVGAAISVAFLPVLAPFLPTIGVALSTWVPAVAGTLGVTNAVFAGALAAAQFTWATGAIEKYTGAFLGTEKLTFLGSALDGLMVLIPVVSIGKYLAGGQAAAQLLRGEGIAVSMVEANQVAKAAGNLGTNAGKDAVKALIQGARELTPAHVLLDAKAIAKFSQTAATALGKGATVAEIRAFTTAAQKAGVTSLPELKAFADLAVKNEFKSFSSVGQLTGREARAWDAIKSGVDSFKTLNPVNIGGEVLKVGAPAAINVPQMASNVRRAVDTIVGKLNGSLDGAIGMIQGMKNLTGPQKIIVLAQVMMKVKGDVAGFAALARQLDIKGPVALLFKEGELAEAALEAFASVLAKGSSPITVGLMVTLTEDGVKTLIKALGNDAASKSISSLTQLLRPGVEGLLKSSRGGGELGVMFAQIFNEGGQAAVNMLSSATPEVLQAIVTKAQSFLGVGGNQGNQFFKALFGALAKNKDTAAAAGDNLVAYIKNASAKGASALDGINATGARELAQILSNGGSLAGRVVSEIPALGQNALSNFTAVLNTGNKSAISFVGALGTSQLKNFLNANQPVFKGLLQAVSKMDEKAAAVFASRFERVGSLLGKIESTFSKNANLGQIVETFASSFGNMSDNVYNIVMSKISNDSGLKSFMKLLNLGGEKSATNILSFLGNSNLTGAQVRIFFGLTEKLSAVALKSFVTDALSNSEGFQIILSAFKNVAEGRAINVLEKFLRQGGADIGFITGIVGKLDNPASLELGQALASVALRSGAADFTGLFAGAMSYLRGYGIVGQAGRMEVVTAAIANEWKTANGMLQLKNVIGSADQSLMASFGKNMEAVIARIQPSVVTAVESAPAATSIVKSFSEPAQALLAKMPEALGDIEAFAKALGDRGIALVNQLAASPKAMEGLAVLAKVLNPVMHVLDKSFVGSFLAKLTDTGVLQVVLENKATAGFFAELMGKVGERNFARVAELFNSLTPARAGPFFETLISRPEAQKKFIAAIIDLPDAKFANLISFIKEAPSGAAFISNAFKSAKSMDVLYTMLGSPELKALLARVGDQEAKFLGVLVGNLKPELVDGAINLVTKMNPESLAIFVKGLSEPGLEHFAAVYSSLNGAGREALAIVVNSFGEFRKGLNFLSNLFNAGGANTAGLKSLLDATGKEGAAKLVNIIKDAIRSGAKAEANLIKLLTNVDEAGGKLLGAIIKDMSPQAIETFGRVIAKAGEGGVEFFARVLNQLPVEKVAAMLERGFAGMTQKGADNFAKFLSLMAKGPDQGLVAFFKGLANSEGNINVFAPMFNKLGGFLSGEVKMLANLFKGLDAVGGEALAKALVNTTGDAAIIGFVKSLSNKNILGVVALFNGAKEKMGEKIGLLLEDPTTRANLFKVLDGGANVGKSLALVLNKAGEEGFATVQSILMEKSGTYSKVFADALNVMGATRPEIAELFGEVMSKVSPTEFKVLLDAHLATGFKSIYSRGSGEMLGRLFGVLSKNGMGSNAIRDTLKALDAKASKEIVGRLIRESVTKGKPMTRDMAGQLATSISQVLGKSADANYIKGIFSGLTKIEKGMADGERLALKDTLQILLDTKSSGLSASQRNTIRSVLRNLAKGGDDEIYTMARSAKLDWIGVRNVIGQASQARQRIMLILENPNFFYRTAYTQGVQWAAFGFSGANFFLPFGYSADHYDQALGKWVEGKGWYIGFHDPVLNKYFILLGKDHFFSWGEFGSGLLHAIKLQIPGFGGWSGEYATHRTDSARAMFNDGRALGVPLGIFAFQPAASNVLASVAHRGLLSNVIRFGELNINRLSNRFLMKPLISTKYIPEQGMTGIVTTWLTKNFAKRVSASFGIAESTVAESVATTTAMHFLASGLVGWDGVMVIHALTSLGTGVGTSIGEVVGAWWAPTNLNRQKEIAQTIGGWVSQAFMFLSPMPKFEHQFLRTILSESSRTDAPSLAARLVATDIMAGESRVNVGGRIIELSAADRISVLEVAAKAFVLDRYHESGKDNLSLGRLHDALTMGEGELKQSAIAGIVKEDPTFRVLNFSGSEAIILERAVSEHLLNEANASPTAIVERVAIHEKDLRNGFELQAHNKLTEDMRQELISDAETKLGTRYTAAQSQEIYERFGAERMTEDKVQKAWVDLQIKRNPLYMKDGIVTDAANPQAVKLTDALIGKIRLAYEKGIIDELAPKGELSYVENSEVSPSKILTADVGDVIGEKSKVVVTNELKAMAKVQLIATAIVGTEMTLPNGRTFIVTDNMKAQAKSKVLIWEMNGQREAIHKNAVEQQAYFKGELQQLMAKKVNGPDLFGAEKLTPEDLQGLKDMYGALKSDAQRNDLALEVSTLFNFVAYVRARGIPFSWRQGQLWSTLLAARGNINMAAGAGKTPIMGIRSLIEAMDTRGGQDTTAVMLVAETGAGVKNLLGENFLDLKKLGDGLGIRVLDLGKELQKLRAGPMDEAAITEFNNLLRTGQGEGANARRNILVIDFDTLGGALSEFKIQGFLKAYTETSVRIFDEVHRVTTDPVSYVIGASDDKEGRARSKEIYQALKNLEEVTVKTNEDAYVGLSADGKLFRIKGFENENSAIHVYRSMGEFEAVKSLQAAIVLDSANNVARVSDKAADLFKYAMGQVEHKLNRGELESFVRGRLTQEHLIDEHTVYVSNALVDGKAEGQYRPLQRGLGIRDSQVIEDIAYLTGLNGRRAELFKSGRFDINYSEDIGSFQILKTERGISRYEFFEYSGEHRDHVRFRGFTATAAGYENFIQLATGVSVYSTVTNSITNSIAGLQRINFFESRDGVNSSFMDRVVDIARRGNDLKSADGLSAATYSGANNKRMLAGIEDASLQKELIARLVKEGLADRLEAKTLVFDVEKQEAVTLKSTQYNSVEAAQASKKYQVIRRIIDNNTSEDMITAIVKSFSEDGAIVISNQRGLTGKNFQAEGTVLLADIKVTTGELIQNVERLGRTIQSDEMRALINNDTGRFDAAREVYLDKQYLYTQMMNAYANRSSIEKTMERRSEADKDGNRLTELDTFKAFQEFFDAIDSRMNAGETLSDAVNKELSVWGGRDHVQSEAEGANVTNKGGLLRMSLELNLLERNTSVAKTIANDVFFQFDLGRTLNEAMTRGAGNTSDRAILEAFEKDFRKSKREAEDDLNKGHDISDAETQLWNVSVGSRDRAISLLGKFLREDGAQLSRPVRQLFARQLDNLVKQALTISKEDVLAGNRRDFSSFANTARESTYRTAFIEGRKLIFGRLGLDIAPSVDGAVPKASREVITIARDLKASGVDANTSEAMYHMLADNPLYHYTEGGKKYLTIRGQNYMQLMMGITQLDDDSKAALSLLLSSSLNTTQSKGDQLLTSWNLVEALMDANIIDLQKDASKQLATLIGIGNLVATNPELTGTNIITVGMLKDAVRASLTGYDLLNGEKQNALVKMKMDKVVGAAQARAGLTTFINAAAEANPNIGSLKPLAEKLNAEHDLAQTYINNVLSPTPFAQFAFGWIVSPLKNTFSKPIDGAKKIFNWATEKGWENGGWKTSLPRTALVLTPVILAVGIPVSLGVISLTMIGLVVTGISGVGMIATRYTTRGQLIRVFAEINNRQEMRLSKIGDGNFDVNAIMAELFILHGNNFTGEERAVKAITVLNQLGDNAKVTRSRMTLADISKVAGMDKVTVNPFMLQTKVEKNEKQDFHDAFRALLAERAKVRMEFSAPTMFLANVVAKASAAMIPLSYMLGISFSYWILPAAMIVGMVTGTKNPLNQLSSMSFGKLKTFKMFKPGEGEFKPVSNGWLQNKIGLFLLGANGDLVLMDTLVKISEKWDGEAAARVKKKKEADKAEEEEMKGIPEQFRDQVRKAKGQGKKAEDDEDPINSLGRLVGTFELIEDQDLALMAMGYDEGDIKNLREGDEKIGGNKLYENKVTIVELARSIVDGHGQQDLSLRLEEINFKSIVKEITENRKKLEQQAQAPNVVQFQGSSNAKPPLPAQLVQTIAAKHNVESWKVIAIDRLQQESKTGTFTPHMIDQVAANFQGEGDEVKDFLYRSLGVEPATAKENLEQIKVVMAEELNRAGNVPEAMLWAVDRVIEVQELKPFMAQIDFNKVQFAGRMGAALMRGWAEVFPAPARSDAAHARFLDRFHVQFSAYISKLTPSERATVLAQLKKSYEVEKYQTPADLNGDVVEIQTAIEYMHASVILSDLQTAFREAGLGTQLPELYNLLASPQVGQISIALLMANHNLGQQNMQLAGYLAYHEADAVMRTLVQDLDLAIEPRAEILLTGTGPAISIGSQRTFNPIVLPSPRITNPVKPSTPTKEAPKPETPTAETPKKGDEAPKAAADLKKEAPKPEAPKVEELKGDELIAAIGNLQQNYEIALGKAGIFDKITGDYTTPAAKNAALGWNAAIAVINNPLFKNRTGVKELRDPDVNNSNFAVKTDKESSVTAIAIKDRDNRWVTFNLTTDDTGKPMIQQAVVNDLFVAGLRLFQIKNNVQLAKLVEPVKPASSSEVKSPSIFSRGISAFLKRFMMFGLVATGIAGLKTIADEIPHALPSLPHAAVDTFIAFNPHYAAAVAFAAAAVAILTVGIIQTTPVSISEPAIREGSQTAVVMQNGRRVTYEMPNSYRIPEQAANEPEKFFVQPLTEVAPNHYRLEADPVQIPAVSFTAVVPAAQIKALTRELYDISQSFGFRQVGLFEKMMDGPLAQVAGLINVTPLLRKEQASLGQFSNDASAKTILADANSGKVVTLDQVSGSSKGFKAFVYKLVIENGKSVTLDDQVYVATAFVRAQMNKGPIALPHTHSQLPSMGMMDMGTSAQIKRIFGEDAPVVMVAANGKMNVEGALFTGAANTASDIQVSPSQEVPYQSFNLNLVDGNPVESLLARVLNLFSTKPTNEFQNSGSKAVARAAILAAEQLDQMNLGAAEYRQFWGLAGILATNGAPLNLKSAQEALNGLGMRSGLGLDQILLAVSNQMRQTLASTLSKNPMFGQSLGVAARSSYRQFNSVAGLLPQQKVDLAADLLVLNASMLNLGDAAQARAEIARLNKNLASLDRNAALAQLKALAGFRNGEIAAARLEAARTAAGQYVTRGDIDDIFDGKIGGDELVQKLPVALQLLLGPIVDRVARNAGLKLEDHIERVDVQVKYADELDDAISARRAGVVMEGKTAHIVIGISRDSDPFEALAEAMVVAHEVGHPFASRLLANEKRGLLGIPTVLEEVLSQRLGSQALRDLGLHWFADIMDLTVAQRVAELADAKATFVPYRKIADNKENKANWLRSLKQNAEALPVVAENQAELEDAARNGIPAILLEQLATLQPADGEVPAQTYARLYLGVSNKDNVQVAMSKQMLLGKDVSALWKIIVSLKNSVEPVLSLLLQSDDFNQEFNRILNSIANSRKALTHA